MTGWCGLFRGPALGATQAPQTTSDPMSRPALPGVESAQCGWHLLGMWRPHTPWQSSRACEKMGYNVGRVGVASFSWM